VSDDSSSANLVQQSTSNNGVMSIIAIINHRLHIKVYGRLGDKTFGRQTFGRQIFSEMTMWATRVGHLGDRNWTFGRQSSRRLGDKNEAND